MVNPLNAISEPHLRPVCKSHLLYTKNGSLMLSVKHGSQVSCLAQTGLVDFGKLVQLISGSSYAETEQRPQVTSLGAVPVTS